MRIVIPTNDGVNVADHFGRCKKYVLLDESGSVIEEFDNNTEHMGGSGLPPELMKAHDADVLLCKALGLRALKLCESLGIKVYTSDVSSIKQLFSLWKQGKLTSADACEEHV